MLHSPLVVLGGGPGGYTAAFYAADLGMDVTIVDVDARLGGTCLLRGCIPSKALIHAAKTVTEAEHAEQWGISFGKPKIDVDKLRGRKNQVVSTLTSGLGQLAKKRGVRVIQARGVFVDSTTLQLEDGDPKTYEESSRLTCDNLILATGSQVAMPGFLQLGSDRVMDSTAALNLPDIPERLLLLGGGYIGLELGSVYANLGSKVTCVEMMPGLLPGADRDILRPLEKALERQFEAIHCNTKLASAEMNGEKKVRVRMEGEHEGEDTFDRLLVSVGRKPRSSGFGLENTGVKLDEKGFVRRDEQMRTDDEHIFAVGDVVGDPMLAHKAAAEARVAVEVLAGRPAKFDFRAIPAVMFTDPEIAWTGLTEEDAKAEGIEVEVSRYPWTASGRAQSLGRTEGLTKLLIEPDSERILGAGIAGPGADEMIAEATLAIEMGATAEDLAMTIHQHPTMSETLAFAAEAFYGTATEIYRPRKSE